MFVRWFLIAGFMLACNGGVKGTSPCQDYVDAATACTKGHDLAELTPSQQHCASDDGSDDALYECLAEAFNSGDCSTEDGAIAAAAEIIRCGLGDTGDTGG